LVGTPEVMPQTSYVSYGLAFAVMVAGGFVYKHKKAVKECEDTFIPLI